MADISSKENEMNLKVINKVTLRCSNLTRWPAHMHNCHVKGPAFKCGGLSCVVRGGPALSYDDRYALGHFLETQKVAVWVS